MVSCMGISVFASNSNISPTPIHGDIADLTKEEILESYRVALLAKANEPARASI